MKTILYPDGSKSVIFEAGDRVRLKKDHDWIAKKGESATVICPEGYSKPIIDFLVIRTDAMIAGRWGTIKVPPWDLDPLDERRSGCTARSVSESI